MVAASRVKQKAVRMVVQCQKCGQRRELDCAGPFGQARKSRASFFSLSKKSSFGKTDFKNVRRCFRHSECSGFPQAALPAFCGTDARDANGEKTDCGSNPYVIVPDSCTYIDQRDAAREILKNNNTTHTHVPNSQKEPTFDGSALFFNDEEPLSLSLASSLQADAQAAGVAGGGADGRDAAFDHAHRRPQTRRRGDHIIQPASAPLWKREKGINRDALSLSLSLERGRAFRLVGLTRRARRRRGRLLALREWASRVLCVRIVFFLLLASSSCGLTQAERCARTCTGAQKQRGASVAAIRTPYLRVVGIERDDQMAGGLARFTPAEEERFVAMSQPPANRSILEKTKRQAR